MKSKCRASLGVFLTLFSIAFGMQNAVAAEFCVTSSADQIKGTQGGYSHELWNEKSQGTACMDLGAGAAFTARWSGIQNYLARRGLGYNQTQKHHEIGSLNASYNVTYSPDCSSGNSYVGVYGWTYDASQSSPNDLVEYYIVENWCNWNPSMDTSAQKMGAIFGGDYDVVKVKRTNAPSIKGNRDFMQYFSIRKNVRTTGLINISEHFYNWEKLGMKMGNMHEVSMLVEGYQNSGSAKFSALDVYTTSGSYAKKIYFNEDSYSVKVGQELQQTIEFHPEPVGTTLADYKVVSNNTNVVSVVRGKLGYLLQGIAAGTTTISITSLSTDNTDTATVTVTPNAAAKVAQKIEFRALGTTGTEKANVMLNGVPVGTEHYLTTDFAVYKDTIFGEGELSVEFINGDSKQSGRDVRLDYVSVNGVKRQTEAMGLNSAAYGGGVCGGGSFTEWLHCYGTVSMGYLDTAHKITVRARGNAGGEHIVLLLNGQPVSSGWTLTTAHKEYSVTVNGGGDLSVKYDNDGGSKDVIVDWLKVDSQGPRQAENMQYNTGYFANGRCGGGSKSEWMQCNGVIGFGKISDKY